jgi:hypothetical protein
MAAGQGKIDAWEEGAAKAEFKRAWV